MPDSQARNIMERLPKPLHAAVRRVLRQAWELNDAEKAEKLIRSSLGGWSTTHRVYRRAFWRDSTKSSQSRGSACRKNFVGRSPAPTSWRMS